MLVNGSDFYCGNSSNNLCQLALRNQIPPQVDTSQFALKREIENTLSKKSIERTISISSVSEDIEIFTKDEMIDVSKNRMIIRLDLDGKVYPKYSDSYFYFVVSDTEAFSNDGYICSIRGRQKGEVFNLSSTSLFIKSYAFTPNGNGGGTGTPCIYGYNPIRLYLSSSNPPSSGSFHLKITSFSI